MTIPAELKDVLSMDPENPSVTREQASAVMRWEQTLTRQATGLEAAYP